MNLLSHVEWPLFLLAMAAVELTPGPNMGWLAALSAQSGRKAGMQAVFGITIGLAIQVIAAATGLAAIAATSSILYELLRWSGIAFMVYLAWDAWQATSEKSPAPSGETESFTRGMIANLLNPKALAFYVVVVGQFTRPESGAVWLQILVLGGLHLAIAFAVHTGIVILGARLGDRIADLRTSIAVRAIFAASLLAIAVWIALTTGQYSS